jgi:glutaconyl-CoA/methylmalonyl-CoA decarboxylase subunit gamma
MKKFQFTISGNKYDVELKSFEENIAEIEVNGTAYSVELQQEVKVPKTPKLVRPEVVITRAESKIKKNISIAVQTVKAPLPGTVMHIFVKDGDAIKKGDKLLMYEAMKMENTILAEKEGIVKSVKTAVGQNILQGEVLLEIE